MFNEQRQEINHIDNQLITLLERRLEVVTEVAQIKHANQMAILDSQREQAILERLEMQVKDPEKTSYLLDAFQAIMNNSKQYQADIIQNKDHSSE